MPALDLPRESVDSYALIRVMKPYVQYQTLTRVIYFALAQNVLKSRTLRRNFHQFDGIALEAL
jgi:hypothetical protein